MIYLTRKQLEIIAQQLAAISVKDSDFDLTEEINDDDFVAIVQNGINKRILISTLREGISRGEKGDPGVGIESVAIDNDGYMTITFTDDTSWTSDVSVKGPQGTAGVGVPTGGTTGQVLAKKSGSDYDTEWVNQSGGGGGTGSVTSVAMTVPTGLSVSGSPITSSGTLAVGYASGYSIPTTAKQTTWDNKQDALVSGTNIKTINNQSILGSGNITISGGGGTMNYQKVTQAEYDAMYSGGTLSNSILYVIVD